HAGRRQRVVAQGEGGVEDLLASFSAQAGGAVQKRERGEGVTIEQIEEGRHRFRSEHGGGRGEGTRRRLAPGAARTRGTGGRVAAGAPGRRRPAHRARRESAPPRWRGPLPAPGRNGRPARPRSPPPYAAARGC